MSHFSRIKTQFKNREALVSCLSEMGLSIEYDTAIQGFRGQQNVDIAARGRNGHDIGFMKNADGSYDMVADWWAKAGSREQEIARALQEQAGRIQQEYARRMVLAQVQSEGFSVVEEQTEQDGSVRIVVRRWVS
jgi:hypothetical protein